MNPANPPKPGQAQSAAYTLENAIVRLKNNGGQAYDEFVNAFESFTFDVTVAVTDAPPDQILVAQGRAQNCRTLLMKLTDPYVRTGGRPKTR